MAVGEEAIRRLVYRSCMALDAEDFETYLGFCGAAYRYQIRTYSPELKKDIVWLDHGRRELTSMLEMVPQHVRLPGKFMRHATVYAIEPADTPGAFDAVSTLTVYYTDPDGDTRVFAVGRYHDRFETEDGAAKLAAREVRLETRILGAGSHLPM